MQEEKQKPRSLELILGVKDVGEIVIFFMVIWIATKVLSKPGLKEEKEREESKHSE